MKKAKLMRGAQIVTTAVAEDQDNSWGSIYKIGAVALPLSPLIYILGQAIQYWLTALPYPNIATGPGSGLIDFLDFIGANNSLYNAQWTLTALAVVLVVPAAIALMAALRKTDLGIASMATALIGLGIVFSLYQVVMAFTEISEAVTWNSGCTVCGDIPLQAAAGTFSGGTAGQLGSLLLALGVLMLSVLMLRGTMFSKVSGYLGVIAALEGIAGSFVFSNLDGGDAVLAGVTPFVLLTIWGITISPRLLRLGRGSAPVST
jgi:hypothetical protein